MKAYKYMVTAKKTAGDGLGPVPAPLRYPHSRQHRLEDVETIFPQAVVLHKQPQESDSGDKGPVKPK